MRNKALIAVMLLWCTHAMAVTIEQPLRDPAREAHAQALFHSLKCVVCEGQSLAESDATLAVQMRAHIREMLDEGKSQDEVVEFFRARYGDRIVMTPPFTWRTALLWAAPFVFLLTGILAIARLMAKKRN